MICLAMNGLLRGKSYPVDLVILPRISQVLTRAAFLIISLHPQRATLIRDVELSYPSDVQTEATKTPNPSED